MTQARTMPPISPQFQELLQKLVYNQGISRRRLARYVGVTPAAIRHLLDDELRELPKPATLRALAEVLDLPVATLVTAALEPETA